MKDLCPDCHAELTPSIVGYMCHNCGAVHQIDKIANASPSSKLAKKSTSSEEDYKRQFDITPRKNLMSSNAPSTLKFKHKLHSFVVPKISELPKPIDESHLLEASYPPGDDEISQLPLGQPSEETPEPLPRNGLSTDIEYDSLDNNDHPETQSDPGKDNIESPKISEQQGKVPVAKRDVFSKIIVVVAIIFVLISLLIYFRQNILDYYHMIKK